MSPQARVVVFFSFAYFMSYLLRGVNLVLAPQLMRDLDLNLAELGMLTSVYLFAFAGFQVPLGIILDRYGPRRVEAVLLTVAASGAFIFSIADSLVVLLIGRALIGLGFAACLNGSVKAVAMWFPADRVAVMNGAVFALGGLGGAVSGTPAQLAVNWMDWRVLFLLLAALTLLAGMLLFVCVPEHPVTRARISLRLQLQQMRAILRGPVFWSVALLTGISNGAFLSVQGLWAGPFMQDVERFDAQTVAYLVVVIALAMVAGGFLLGWAAREIEKGGISLYVTTGAAIAIFQLVQIALLADLGIPPVLLWIAYGFFGSAGILGYAVVARIYPPESIGVAGTTLTLITFVSAFLFQFGFGALIEVWSDTMGGEPSTAHRVAWIVALAAQAAPFLPYAYYYRKAVRSPP